MTSSQPTDETRSILTAAQAILADDHFVYVSGDHGSGWIDKDVIFVDPQRIRRLTQMLAAMLHDEPCDLLCGPATGGLIVAQWTALALRRQAVFAEHDAPRSRQELRGRFALHRGYDARVAGQRVLVVDDVANTGHSLRQTIGAVRAAGGTVTTAAALVDRGNIDAAGLGVAKYIYLLEHDIPSWPAAGCPLCQQGVPINIHHAHGQDFVDALRSR